MQAHYLPGVGAGGNGERGGGNAGGAGMVRITFISNSSFIRKSFFLFLLLFLSRYIYLPFSFPFSPPVPVPTFIVQIFICLHS